MSDRQDTVALMAATLAAGNPVYPSDEALRRFAEECARKALALYWAVQREIAADDKAFAAKVAEAKAVKLAAATRTGGPGE